MSNLQQSAMDRDDQIIDSLEENMFVYDADGNRVGDITFLHFGEGHDAASVSEVTMDDPTNSALTDTITDVFGKDTQLPEELRKKLYRHGFARVDGALTKTYFFIPEQIARIEDDTVHLNVSKGELVQR